MKCQLKMVLSTVELQYKEQQQQRIRPANHLLQTNLIRYSFA
jgi:hypothetical protein